MLAIRRDDPYSCSDDSVGVSVHKIDSVNLGQKLNLLFRRRYDNGDIQIQRETDDCMIS